MQREQRAPAQLGKTEQGQGDVALNGVACEQRDDLIGACHAEMRPAAARDAGDIAVEEMDRPAVRGELPHDEIEQRSLAGPVRSDDQAPLSRLDEKIDIGGDIETAEGLPQMLDGKRAHCFEPELFAPAAALSRPRSTPDPRRHSRAVPGTRPSGIKMTMATNMAPSMKFQRSI